MELFLDRYAVEEAGAADVRTGTLWGVPAGGRSARVTIFVEQRRAVHLDRYSGEACRRSVAGEQSAEPEPGKNGSDAEADAGEGVEQGESAVA